MDGHNESMVKGLCLGWITALPILWATILHYAPMSDLTGGATGFIFAISIAVWLMSVIVFLVAELR